MGMPPPSFARRARMPPDAFGDSTALASSEAFWDDICMRARRSWMEPPGGVFGVVGSDDVLRGMGGGGPPEPVRRCVGIGGGPPDPVRRCVGIGGGPALPVEDAFDDVRRCVGIGGGALLGDLVGGGAGAASLAIRAAIAEALPEDLGVFAAAFSFLAASSLAFAFAIISATPIFCGGCRGGVRCTPFFMGGVPRRRRSCAAEIFWQHWAAREDDSCVPRLSAVGRGVALAAAGFDG